MSTGVTGLTVNLSAGTFVNGSGNLIFTISGTASTFGVANFAIIVGGQSCNLVLNVMVGGPIYTLDCGSATTNGTLTKGVVASNVNTTISYTGGNGSAYAAQSVPSTGVLGLTADLAAGNFANGSGNLTYSINGNPFAAGTATFAISVTGLNCSFSVNVLPFVGSIATLDCGAAITTGSLIQGTLATNAITRVPYTGGNGGPYAAQTVSSTGVSGLTANLPANNFSNGGSFTLEYTISGTPTSSGTATFAITVGGKSCSFSAYVYSCIAGPTTIIEVTNPTTGRIWMDRNLGALQAATSITDAAGYGDLYQWGRLTDGHQCRNSATTSTLSSSDQPGHGNFITTANSPNDWRSPQNINLWQGISGINNPCPSSYRLPTINEWATERFSWSSNNAAGAFSSVLKLPMAGYRIANGTLVSIGSNGYYWSSSRFATDTYSLTIGNNGAATDLYGPRVWGHSVRCIKN
ncbi:MAG: hypothetical protein ACOYOA_03185 [Saprospiraceae bacterium]